MHALPDETPERITRLLEAAAAGDGSAPGELLPLVYRALQGIARRQMRSQRPGHTLQATVLVHEAYMRIVGSRSVPCQNRMHFFSAAAAAMRRLLIDHARRAGARKRGGDRRRDVASVADLASPDSVHDAIEIDAAIDALRAVDPRAAGVVQLRFFTGLSVDETAELLGVAASTVDRDWRYARAWLLRYLQRAESDEAKA